MTRTTTVAVDIEVAGSAETELVIDSAVDVEISVYTGDVGLGLSGEASTASTGTSHSLALPDGSDATGHLLVVLGHDNAAVDISTTLQGMGFTELAGDSWPPDYDFDILWRNIDGSEGWPATGATLDFTTPSSTNIAVSIFRFTQVYNDGVGSFWDSSQGLVTADPPSIAPSWGAATDTFVVAAVLSEAAISGTPTGYTVYANLQPGDLYMASTATWDSGATINPGAFTTVSPILCWTIIIRGVGQTGDELHRVDVESVIESSVDVVELIESRVEVEISVHTGDIDSVGG
jgi:hypothetical protein